MFTGVQEAESTASRVNIDVQEIITVSSFLIIDQSKSRITSMKCIFVLAKRI